MVSCGHVLLGPLRLLCLDVSAREHRHVAVLADEPALAEFDGRNEPLYAVDLGSVAYLEVRVPQEIDADDGVLGHLRKGAGDAQRDEPDDRPEAGGDVAHPDDFRDRQP